MTFVYLMDDLKKLNQNIIEDHVNYLKKLHEKNKLILCGPFTNYPGGIVIISAQDQQEAIAIVNSDPFIEYGYKSFSLRTIELANEDNNYLL